MPDEVLRYGDFNEYCIGELVDAVDELGLDDDSPVEIEIQDPMGNVIAGEVVRLRAVVGRDEDREGGYTWLKIIGRQEPRDGEPFA